MKMSPIKFRNELLDHLLNLHWKQWSAFGVSSHLTRNSNYILDLEALTVSTIALGLRDKRLAHITLEWLQVNRQWLNLHRMKRIGKLFTKYETYKQMSLLDSDVMDVYQNFLKPSSSLSALNKDYENYPSDSVNEHINLVSNFKARGTVVDPDINSNCLLQLFLRSIFGIDARAEMFLYFICGRRGNSNYISSEIHFAQRNLLKILNNWADAGIIEENLEVSSPDYGLKNHLSWIQALGIDNPSIYVNWSRIFLFLDRLVLGLENLQLQNDNYLASSFFRDLAQDIRYAASVTQVDLPHEKSLHGQAYFEPFAKCVLQIIDKLSQ